MAMLCLAAVLCKCISDIYNFNWSIWLTIERLCKLFNVYLGLTLIFEKQIYTLFMVYQVHLSPNQLDVMKDNYRRVEYQESRKYFYQMIGVTVFIVVTLGVTLLIPANNDNYMLWKVVDNLFILGIQGIVLRRYVITNLTFLQLMKNAFSYEYEQHVTREVSTFVITFVSFVLLDCSNVAIYFSDTINLMCSWFYDDIDLTKSEYAEISESICTPMVYSIACYQIMAPIFAAIYALPAIAFIIVNRPHDCFHCLSIRPENRISNYQLGTLALEQRKNTFGSERNTGGAFEGFKINFKGPYKLADKERMHTWTHTTHKDFAH